MWTKRWLICWHTQSILHPEKILALPFLTCSFTPLRFSRRLLHSLHLFSCMVSQWICSIILQGGGGGVWGSAVLDPHELMPLGNRRNPSYLRTHTWMFAHAWMKKQFENAKARAALPVHSWRLHLVFPWEWGQKHGKAWWINSDAIDPTNLSLVTRCKSWYDLRTVLFLSSGCSN